MNKIAVVGAGHAGIAAVSALMARGYAVDIFSNEAGLPYFRPRLIAVAFGQAEPDAITIKPEHFYVGSIRLIHAAVTSPESLKDYRGVILTQGSTPFVPPFNGDVGRLYTLWTMEDALALRKIIKAGMRLTIIGGGVLGIEAALRARLAGMQVTLIEVAPQVLNGKLSGEAYETFLGQLRTKGIVLHIGQAVKTILSDAVQLADGQCIADDVLLCSTGARGNFRLAESMGATIDKGIVTHPDLSIAPTLFAAGDIARPTALLPTCSVRRATMMGTLAAENLVATLEGRPTKPWVDPQLPLFMKVDDVTLNLN